MPSPSPGFIHLPLNIVNRFISIVHHTNTTIHNNTAAVHIYASIFSQEMHITNRNKLC